MNIVQIYKPEQLILMDNSTTNMDDMEVDPYKTVKRKRGNSQKNLQNPSKIPKKLQKQNIDPALTGSQSVNNVTSTKSAQRTGSSIQLLNPGQNTPDNPGGSTQITSKPKAIEAKVSLQVLQNYIKSSSSVISLKELSLQPFVKESCKHVRIQCASLEIKEKIIKLLAIHQIPYYTYTEKSDKSVVYVLNGYDVSSDPDSILEDLKEHNIPAVKVTTIVQSSDSRKAVHLVHFQNDSININLLNHQHKSVYGAKLRWEVRTRNNNNKKLTQCHNCQRWGHSSLHCTFPARCVKCNSNHSTKDCTRIRSSEIPPKCVNCGGDHTANYSKCPEAIRYYQRTRPISKIQKSKQTPPTIHNSSAWESQNVNYNHDFPNTLMCASDQPDQTSAKACSCSVKPSSVQHRIEEAKHSVDPTTITSNNNSNSYQIPQEKLSELVKVQVSDIVKESLVSLAPLLSLPSSKLEILLKVLIKLIDLISGSQNLDQLIEHFFTLTPNSTNSSSGEFKNLNKVSRSSNENGS